MDNGVEDIYHRCIDITLKKGAMNSPGVIPMQADSYNTFTLRAHRDPLD
jgi:hypothetical protein